MPADPRIEEAFRILRKPGGPTRTESKHARELVREWLDDEERAEGEAGEEDEPSTAWEDVAPPEVLNEKATAASRRATQSARLERPRKRMR